MGQARTRGTYEERKAAALAAGRTPEARKHELPLMRRVFRGTGRFKDARGREYAAIDDTVRRVR